jgi:prevent-host-death family protein
VRVVSATVAAKTFGRLVDRVREQQSTCVVERSGTPVARIVPIAATSCTVADLVDVLRSRERLDAEYLDEVAWGQDAWNQPAVPDDRWGR